MDNSIFLHLDNCYRLSTEEVESETKCLKYENYDLVFVTTH